MNNPFVRLVIKLSKKFRYAQKIGKSTGLGMQAKGEIYKNKLRNKKQSWPETNNCFYAIFRTISNIFSQAFV